MGEILHSLDNRKQSSSNLDKFLETAMGISANAATVWSSGSYQQRERIQKVIFPEGVYYILENEAFAFQGMIKKDRRPLNASCPVMSGQLDNCRTIGLKI